MNGVQNPVSGDGTIAPAPESPVDESTWEGFEDEDPSQSAIDDQPTSELDISNVLPEQQKGESTKRKGKATKKGAIFQVQKAASSTQGNSFDALGTTDEADESDGKLTWIQIYCVY